MLFVEYLLVMHTFIENVEYSNDCVFFDVTSKVKIVSNYLNLG